MQCNLCGTQLPVGVAYCPTCGVATPYNVSASGGSPYDPTFLSSPPGTPPYQPATDYGSSPYGGAEPNPYEFPNPYAVTLQAPPPPPRPSRGKVSGGLVGLVLLLLFGMSGIVAYTLHSNQVAASATATVERNATASIISRTATAAAATATAVALNADPYPPAGSLALRDPLSQPLHWTNYAADKTGGACQFTNGSYYVSEAQSNEIHTCIAQGGLDYSNFAFEVQMEQLKGDCGGMAFRDDGSGINDYDVIVCEDGSYSLSVTTEPNVTTKIVKSGTSLAIQTGLKQANTIAVVANGNRVNLYVNRQEIASVTDNTYSHGTIGFLAEALSNSTEVAYSNAKVWTW